MSYYSNYKFKSPEDIQAWINTLPLTEPAASADITQTSNFVSCANVTPSDGSAPKFDSTNPAGDSEALFSSQVIYTDSSLCAESDIPVSIKNIHDHFLFQGRVFLYISCGLTFILLIDMILVIKIPFVIPFKEATVLAIALVILLCLWNAHRHFHKANMIQICINAQRKMRAQLISWFCSTYTAAYLDRILDIENDFTNSHSGSRNLQRLDLIKSYLIREYDIEDTPFLHSICEEIMRKLFNN